MAKKEKGRGRTVYFKDQSLWSLLECAAKKVNARSVNHFIEDTIEERLSNMELPRTKEGQSEYLKS